MAPDSRTVTWILAAIIAVAIVGCGDDGSADAGYTPPDRDGDSGDGGPTMYPDGGTAAALLSRPSRSSAIDITEDDLRVVMVNPEDDSISIFTTADNRHVATVSTGDEPASVVIHPDGRTAFVANQGDATVVKVTGIDSASPAVYGAPVEVGSEPTGLALSPTGARLFVAEWAEGRISVIDTATMTIAGAIDSPRHPRAIAITNDGDADESDELLVVPEFYGEPAAAGAGEASNTGRSGRVRIYSLGDYSAGDPIVFAPIDSGFAPAEGAPTAMTAPNQLWSVAIQGTKVYVTSISASPAAPVRFDSNVFPVVYVGDLATRSEDRGPAGSKNMARLVFDRVPEGETRHALADLVDIAFIGTSNIAYAIARGGDVMQRIVYEETGITVGSDRNAQIELGTAPAGTTTACQNPIGVATSHDAPRAYVDCWVTRNLGVVDLTMQALVTTVESAPPPMGEEVTINKGRRFFFTGRGRWSHESWSSCGSCHPGGYSDNITWSFAAGPRQSTDLSGSYSHGTGAQKQRVFNWTAIFDEMHDFERNTRDTSGGLGAITRAATGECGAIANEVRDPETLPGGLAQPIKELSDRAENCTHDWDSVDAFVRALRPVRALRGLDAASVERGRALFGESSASANNGSCVSCHGGAGWTVSRRFFVPSSATNASLTSAAFAPPSVWPEAWNRHTLQIENEPASTPGGASAAPPQVACVLRNVGTFGVPGDDAATTALEVRVSGAGAQGRGGFNVPSLYGLAVGAPYLHHGQAESLETLFDDPRWQSHLRAANPVFLTTGDPAAQKRDLIAFLLSLDATAPELPLPPSQDACPE